MITDGVKFNLGETVYLMLDRDKSGMITGITFRPSSVMYLVAWTHDFSERSHFDIELTTEKTNCTTP